MNNIILNTQKYYGTEAIGSNDEFVDPVTPANSSNDTESSEITGSVIVGPIIDTSLQPEIAKTYYKLSDTSCKTYTIPYDGSSGVLPLWAGINKRKQNTTDTSFFGQLKNITGTLDTSVDCDWINASLLPCTDNTSTGMQISFSVGTYTPEVITDGIISMVDKIGRIFLKYTDNTYNIKTTNNYIKFTQFSHNTIKVVQDYSITLSINDGSGVTTFDTTSVGVSQQTLTFGLDINAKKINTLASDTTITIQISNLYLSLTNGAQNISTNIANNASISNTITSEIINIKGTNEFSDTLTYKATHTVLPEAASSTELSTGKYIVGFSAMVTSATSLSKYKVIQNSSCNVNIVHAAT